MHEKRYDFSGQKCTEGINKQQRKGLKTISQNLKQQQIHEDEGTKGEKKVLPE